MTRVEFSQQALNELRDAAEYYEARPPGLGDAFTVAARQTVTRIAANPTAYRFVVEDIRRANFPRRWPYSLFFVVRPDRSVVIATLHLRQDLRRLHGRSSG